MTATFGADATQELVVAMSEVPEGGPAPDRRRRADAEENMKRIVQAAMQLLQAEPEAGLEEVAAAAGVSRSTICQPPARLRQCASAPPRPPNVRSSAR